MVVGTSIGLGDLSKLSNALDVNAGTIASYTMPTNIDVPSFSIPLDLQLDQAKKAGVAETTNRDGPEVTKVDNHVVKAPVVVEKRVEVPVLYIATPSEMENPTDTTERYAVHRLENGGIGITVPTSSLGVEPYEE